MLLLTACSRIITPQGEPAERTKAAKAESVFNLPLTQRPLPDLSNNASLPQVLEYAFYASGEIEMAYREWRAAIERVPQAGALPDPSLEFGTKFDASNLKSFSVELGAKQEFPAPGKRRTRAEQALAEARATGERFRKAKFELQRKVVKAYAGLARNEKMIALTSETLRLFRETNNVAGHRFHLGASEALAELRKIEIEIQTAESEQRALLLERQGMVAELNGLLSRKPDAPLGNLALPDIKMPPDSPEQLLSRAASSNPELAAIRHEIEARGAAQTLAELEKRPDYMIEGKAGYPLMPELGLGLTLPINREHIRAGIAEALAMRQSAEARYRATESDTLARLVQSLVAIRDTERITTDYTTRILPKTKELLDAQLASYGSGGGELLDILDTERMLIDFKKLLLQAESDRLRFVAELEEIIGEDLFQFIPGKNIAGRADGTSALPVRPQQ